MKIASAIAFVSLAAWFCAHGCGPGLEPPESGASAPVGTPGRPNMGLPGFGSAGAGTALAGTGAANPDAGGLAATAGQTGSMVGAGNAGAPGAAGAGGGAEDDAGVPGSP